MTLIQTKIFDNIKATVLADVQKFVGDNPITPQNVLDLILYVMNSVEQNSSTTTTGADKKQLVSSVITTLLSGLDIPNKDVVASTISNVFDSFVENVIDVAKNPGTYNFGQIVQNVKKCVIL